MKTREEFCEQLKERIRARKEKIVLRVVVSPEFEKPIEFTGAEILRRAEELASSFAPDGKRSVVLLLMPHCPELFLLQLGLVLAGHVPAVLGVAHNTGLRGKIPAQSGAPVKSFACGPADYLAELGPKYQRSAAVRSAWNRTREWGALRELISCWAGERAVGIQESWRTERKAD